MLHSVGVVLVDFLVGDGYRRLQLGGLLTEDGEGTLDAVGPVGRVRHSHLEELELRAQLLHVRVVGLALIENPLSVSVDGLQRGFDTCSFLSFLSDVLTDMQFGMPLSVFLVDERLENLLEEGVL